MASWQAEYLSALQERDRKEKANVELYNAYTKLADRTSNRDLHTRSEPIPVEQSTAGVQTRKVSGPDALPQSSAGKDLLSVRQDLSEAQRSKGVMQSRLDSISIELQKLKLQSQQDSKRIKELTSEKTALSIRMKDQDEELKGKAKLLEVSLFLQNLFKGVLTETPQDVHDENLSLTLQLNMAEDRSRELRTENKELVDRWMARMGKEAEDMNKNSKFS